MANDDTMYKNVENEEVQEKNEKKSTVSDNLKMAGAAATGAAVGSAASMGAQAAINHYTEEATEIAEAEGTEEGEVDVLAAETPAEPQPQVVEHTTHHYHNTEVHHHHHAAATQHTAAPQQQDEQIAQNNTPEEPQNIEDPNIQQTSDNGGEDVDIHVIGVEHDVNMNGEQVDVAVIDVEGHQGLLIDVDQEGTADVAVIDVDDSGTITENEIQDISDYDVPMPQQTSGDDFMQASDDMPDYTNDAVLV